MKKALLLHGTGGSSQSNWLPWLKDELESLGWDVWVPDLPGADRPNIARYNELLLEKQDWLDSETSIVGHSSGSIAGLGLLQALTNDVVVERTVLVGAFKDDLGWESLSELFDPPLDFERIKKHCHNFEFIHSDDDPYCPLEHAEYLSKQLDGTLQVLPGQKHFSIDTNPEYSKFPLLLELLAYDQTNNPHEES